MYTNDIKRLKKRVTDYLERVDIFGKRTVTIWHGQIADTIYITEENMEAVRELEEYVEKRRNKH